MSILMLENELRTKVDDLKLVCYFNVIIQGITEKSFRV